MERLIELCCATCAKCWQQYTDTGLRMVCLPEGKETTADWFCRNWEQKEDENEL